MRLSNMLAQGPQWASMIALGFCLFAQPVSAENYPSRAITIVVPQAVGSASDNVTRPIAESLRKQLGQAVIVENRAGAAGLIGTSYGARAKPDGYTFTIVSNTTMAANPSMYKELPYDPVKDFVPVALLGKTSMMYVVRPDFPAQTLDQLVAESKQRNVPLTAGYGSSTAQIALHMLTQASDMTVTPVPYNGTPQLMVDLLGGTVDFAVVDVGSGMVQARQNKVTPLAIAASKKLTVSDDVPTMAEKYPGIFMDTWIAIAAPAGTSNEHIEAINKAVLEASKQPEVIKAFQSVAIELATATPEELAETIKADQEKWPDLVKAAGIQPQ